MLSWAVRCAFLIALGVVVVYEVDLDLSLPARDAAQAAGSAAEPVPPADSRRTSQTDSFGSELTVQAGDGGHFFLDASVNGMPISFLVDTGATFIVLSKETAAGLGIRPASHEYTVRVQTANGIIESAPVTLRQVQVGNFTAREVEALVTDTSLGGSLLGLSFLKRLQSYEVRRDRLVMRW